MEHRARGRMAHRRSLCPVPGRAAPHPDQVDVHQGRDRDGSILRNGECRARGRGARAAGHRGGAGIKVCKAGRGPHQVVTQRERIHQATS